MKKRHWTVIVLAVLGTVLGWNYILQPRYFCGPGTPRAPTDIAAILSSLNEYAINNNGVYPCTLEALVVPDADGHSYLEGYNYKLPVDPWKREYHYEVPTPAYPRPHVWSYGADGKRGGTGDDADIDSEDIRYLER